MAVLSGSDPAPVTLDDVKNGIDAVRELMNELKKLDPTTDSKWIVDLPKSFSEYVKQAARSLESKKAEDAVEQAKRKEI
jgi:hypothetical protein